MKRLLITTLIAGALAAEVQASHPQPQILRRGDGRHLRVEAREGRRLRGKSRHPECWSRTCAGHHEFAKPGEKTQRS